MSTQPTRAASAGRAARISSKDDGWPANSSYFRSRPFSNATNCAAQVAPLLAERVESLVLVLGAVSLGEEPADRLVELLELAEQVGLASPFVVGQGPDLPGGDVVEQAAGEVGLPPPPGLSGLPLAGQGEGQMRAR